MQMNPNHKNEAVNDLCLNDFIDRFMKARHQNPNYRYRRDGLPQAAEWQKNKKWPQLSGCGLTFCTHAIAKAFDEFTHQFFG